MKTSIIAALAATLVFAHAAAAQQDITPPKTWVSASGVIYTTIAGFHDPDTESAWRFDDTGFGAGAAVQREIGQGLLLGLEATYVRTKYERLPDDVVNAVAIRGNAGIGTAMATGRFAYGGGGSLGLYLTGGLGMIGYNLEDVGSWSTDFALRAGTGLEYQFRRNMAAGLEWSRLWAYHENDDLGGGRQNHSMLRLSLRYGL